MTIEQIRIFVAANVQADINIQILEDEHFGYLQGWYMEECVVTGELQEQRTRKWKLSPWMKESEIVQTALGMCLASAEHRVREHFLYRGEQVYSPHFDVNALYEIAKARRFQVRDNLPVAAVEIS